MNIGQDSKEVKPKHGGWAKIESKITSTSSFKMVEMSFESFLWDK